jgi:serine/threonine protein kinase
MDLISMDSSAKISFLKQVDLSRVKFEIKIADFGFSKFLDSKSERSNTMCGTPLYMAP